MRSTGSSSATPVGSLIAAPGSPVTRSRRCAMDKPIRTEEIEALVAEFEASGCAELHVRFDGFELHLSSDPAAQAVARQMAPSASPEPTTAARPAAPDSSGPTGAD